MKHEPAKPTKHINDSNWNFFFRKIKSDHVFGSTVPFQETLANLPFQLEHQIYIVYINLFVCVCVWYIPAPDRSQESLCIYILYDAIDKIFHKLI